ncbi:WRKY transcription factor [Dionaea muscipula]
MDQELMKDVDQRSVLIDELLKGKELTKQLLQYLQCPSCPLENQECLLEKIMACFNHGLLSVANLSQVVFMEPSPDSTSHHHHLPSTSKKRKAILPQQTKRIAVGPGSGLSLEGPLNDGYSWRKYGQKDILGAKFPRGYYRCTHRHSRGCPATKQVQRLDQDSTMVQVIYRGNHTCNHHQRAQSLQSPAKLKLEPTNLQDHDHDHDHDHPQQQMLLSLTAAQQLRVQITSTEGSSNSDDGEHQIIFPSNFIELPRDDSEDVHDFIFYPEENNVLIDCLAAHDHQESELYSNYYDQLEISSVTASNTNSPICGPVDFSLDHKLDMDLDFSFDDCMPADFFSSRA